MEDRFGVGFFGEQNMIDNTSDFVRGGRDGGGCAQLRAHSTEELTKIALSAAK